MLKITLIAAALVAAGVSGAVAKPFNVALDGYCNTFALTITKTSIAGTRGGCGYTDIDGGTVASVKKKPYYITNDTNDSAEIFTWLFSPPKQGTGTWTLYESDGTTQSLVNSGTYSPATTSQQGFKDVTR